MLDILGIQVDTVNGTLSLPKVKLECVQSMVQQCEGSKACLRRELEVPDRATQSCLQGCPTWALFPALHAQPPLQLCCARFPPGPQRLHLAK